MEDALVLPVRMGNRRDAIPTINVEFSVSQICPDSVSACVGYTYNIMSFNSVPVVFGSDFAI